MNRPTARHALLVLAAAPLLLAACGKKLEGTYSDPTGVVQFTFQSNGKVVQSTMGARVELPYEIDGKDVRLNAPQGTMLMKINDDGSLEGPMGMTLKRKP